MLKTCISCDICDSCMRLIQLTAVSCTAIMVFLWDFNRIDEHLQCGD